ncbi:MAG: hypothetical protein ACLQU1_02765 [Bryobacteraceae bacterium]
MGFPSVAGNFQESFRVIAASRGAGEIRELPGVSVASSGVTLQMFNAAFLSGQPPATENKGLTALHAHSRASGAAIHRGSSEG